MAVSVDCPTPRWGEESQRVKSAFREAWAGIVLLAVCIAAGYAGYLWFESLGRDGTALVLGSSALLMTALLFLTKEVMAKLDKLIDAADKFEIDSFVGPIYSLVRAIRQRLVLRLGVAVLAGAANAGLAIAIPKTATIEWSSARLMAAIGFAALVFIVFYGIRVAGLLMELDDLRLRVTRAVESERDRAAMLLALNPSKVKSFPDKAILAGHGN
jgi:hypothetical protein